MKENESTDATLQSKWVQKSGVLGCITVLLNYMLFSANGGEIQQSLNSLTAMVKSDFTARLTILYKNLFS